jgi:NAD(P)-dependent dehydrogenase (short-subunit alcohol dehydrogenase family)
MTSWFLNFLYSQLFISLPSPTYDFSGQTIIVTGANTGLGFEAAKHFVRLNASKVILAIRTISKGEAAKLVIQKSIPDSKTKVEVWHLDLSSYESVKAFAAQVMKLDRLDVLLENAGMMTGKFRLVEGNETTITTNVISTELLALLILPKLRETAARYGVLPRLSIVTSDLHFVANFPERNSEDVFAALNYEKKANMGQERYFWIVLQMEEKLTPGRYAVSKLFQVFFVRELGKRIDSSEGPTVIVNCLTPGACRSDFDRESSGLRKVVFSVLEALLARTTEAGSRTLVAGATAGLESHGQYMADCIVAK